MDNQDKYSISVWHGEGGTVWYIMRECIHQPEDWECMWSTSDSLKAAEDTLGLFVSGRVTAMPLEDE